ncbi:MAG: regulatory protein RecX, partial [Chlorobiaceae bacterium]
MGNNSLMSAMGFALKLLGLRGHSCKELEVKLLKKGYSVEIIGPVLEKLTLQGVLDDRMFGAALLQSRSRRKPSGKRK